MCRHNDTIAPGRYCTVLRYGSDGSALSLTTELSGVIR